MSEKINNSIDNFQKALNKLTEYLSLPVNTDRDRAGIIQGFEFTFEQAWRTFQKIAQEEGLEASGPKSAIKQAFAMGLITTDKEDIWLDMLDARNLMSHTYRDQLSKMVAEKVQNNYKPVLDDILKLLKSKF